MRQYRINDQTPLKTKRLIIAPMQEKELEAYMAKEQDALLRAALIEMRRCVIDDPDQALWHTGWRIALRQTDATVGLIAFHGIPTDRTVDLGYDILPAFRGTGYAEEAVKAFCHWAFARENVYFVRAMADVNNGASNHILKKLGFCRIESPVEGQVRWELERPASNWISIYLCIGLAIGLVFGSALFANLITGMVIGLGAGLALGAAMDSQDRAARKREQESIHLDPSEADKRKRR